MELKVDRPADRAVMASALVGGVVIDLALRSGVVGLAGALSVIVAAAILLGSTRLVNPQAKALAAAAPVFGMWLALRSSPWLLVPDIAAAGGLLVLAASFSRAGSVADLSVPRAGVRAMSAVIHGLAGPAFAWRPIADRRTSRTRIAPVLRGVALAVPVLVVLGLLLASADPVFASVFRLPFELPTLLGHLVVVAFGWWATTGLLRLASAAGPPEIGAPTQWRLGSTEATVVLGGLVVLFGGFAASQLVAMGEGGQRVLRTQGLTYAEYARTGYFQLLAVAAITLGTLMTLRAATASRLRLVILAEMAIALTLVVVYVALQRLGLYEAAYGLTMLRFYSVVFAVWLAMVLVMLGVVVAGVGRHRSWLLPAAVGVGLAMLIALNVTNPEAVVVGRQLARGADGREVDTSYLLSLTRGSTDAVPTLVAGLESLKPADRALVSEDLACPDPGGGWAAANRSRSLAERAINASPTIPSGCR